MATAVEREQEQMRYQAWLEQARPLVEAAQWGEAFKTFPWMAFEDAPFSRLTKPLSQCRVALVTSGGISLKSQPPMDSPNIEGDYSIRVLPVDAPASDLVISHTHFPTEMAYRDINVLYPVDRMRELARDGVIGALSPNGYSFMGYNTNHWRFRDETVPQIVEGVRRDGADVAFVIPV